MLSCTYTHVHTCMQVYKLWAIRHILYIFTCTTITCIYMYSIYMSAAPYYCAMYKQVHKLWAIRHILYIFMCIYKSIDSTCTCTDMYMYMYMPCTISTRAFSAANLTSMKLLLLQRISRVSGTVQYTLVVRCL